MSLRVSSIDPDAWSEGPHADHLAALAAREVDVVILRARFDAEQVRASFAGAAVPRSTFPPRQGGRVWGRCLDLSPQLDEYFAQAAQLRDALSAAGSTVERELSAALTWLAGGVQARVLALPDGRSFMPMTLRAFPPGGFIPPHCEQEQLGRGPSRLLLPLIDTRGLYSYSVMVAPAEQGGRLMMHALRWDDIDITRIGSDGRTRVRDLVAARPSVPLALHPGDLAVFDGGHRFHSMERVEGTRDRVTLGGFFARSADRTSVCYWS